ncbi:MAG: hypothetical protein QM762_24305 [Chryseolinea sp.]
MRGITIHYHLAIPAVVSILGLVAICWYRKKLFKRYPSLWACIVIFLGLYLFIVGGALYKDIYYQWDLNRYDLDNDGVFGGEEITSEQTAAMNRLTNDVGRNFSFITGFIFALPIASVVFVFGLLISKAIKAK